MATFEVTWEKALADTEFQALQSELGSVVVSNQWEMYVVQ
jgi:hypothetical protein